MLQFNCTNYVKPDCESKAVTNDRNRTQHIPVKSQEETSISKYKYIYRGYVKTSLLFLAITTLFIIIQEIYFPIHVRPLLQNSL